MRPLTLVAAAALIGVASPCLSHAPTSEAPGSYVSVMVHVDGQATPLYVAPDGSGRYYLEAHRGAGYEVHVANRSGERIGVRLTVDGLNAISGERDATWGPVAKPGRMYVLDPWDSTVVRGWRTSLDEVRRFTFVDEGRSYAVRSGKANEKLGWIEVAVFRERHREPHPWTPYGSSERPRPLRERDGGSSDRSDERGAGAAKAAPGTPSAEAEARAPRPSYPGTGWGARTDDRAMVVSFEPEPTPCERVALRYEYASGLRALGIYPHPGHRDRLAERDRGTGFAKPPRW